VYSSSGTSQYFIKSKELFAAVVKVKFALVNVSTGFKIK
jgi:hypothetical protein